MSKFSIFSLVYAIFASILFSVSHSVSIIDEASIITLLLFLYSIIAGAWSVVASGVKELSIFSLFYVLFSWWISHDADLGMFGPGRKQTILIAVSVYLAFLLIWSGVKFFKKKFRK